MCPNTTQTFRAKVDKALADGGLPRLARMAWNRAIHPLLLLRDKTWLSRRNFAVVLRCRLSRTPVVHVIGDSHVQVFRGVYPYRVTWLGPATAYNLDEDVSSTKSKEKLVAALKHVSKRRDIVVMVLGEIDSRVHIFNQFMKQGQTVSVEALIDATVERYGTVLKRLRVEGYRILVHSVPATPYQENIYGIEHYADDDTRASIVAAFNSRLRSWCEANGLEYLDVYSVVSDSRGFIRKELTTDGTHLDESALPIYREMIESEIVGRGQTGR